MTLFHPASEFVPHPLLRGAHLQTILAKLIKKQIPPTHVRILEVTLPDHDQVIIKISEPDRTPERAARGTVILFHGLGGCAESDYNLRIAQKLNAQGFRAARFSHRGCGSNQEIKAKKIYHSGSVEDLFFALDRLKKEYPGEPIMAVGFSLSGTILLNLLAQKHAASDLIKEKLVGALSVCPPLNLDESSQKLSRLENIIYDQYFTKLLIKQVRHKEVLYPELSKTKFSGFMNLRRFDEVFTARQGGFVDRHDYYQRCSPETHLEHVNLPTYILAAKDDPIVSERPYVNPRLGTHVRVHLTESGGHMGYISAGKTRFGDHRWMDEFVVDWASQMAP